MKLLKYIVILLLLQLSPRLLLYAQTRRALVIGIGEYPSWSGWAVIHGDRDVAYVKDYLNAAHYSDIRTLVNSQATKTNIITALTKLGNDSKSGDILYIHFSGHGQQMLDKNHDERDGLDECWIPYDACKQPCEQDRGEKHLTDDEIYVLLNNIMTKVGLKGKMLVVVDACHSGSSTRNLGNETVRGVWETFEAVLSPRMTADSKQLQIVQGENPWITLSACQSNQLNTEMRDPAVGKLTYGLYTILKKDDKWTDAEFYQALALFMNRNSNRSPQRPTMLKAAGRYSILDILK